MATKTFKVEQIQCGHCAATIERELGQLPGVASVKADAVRKEVTVEWDDPATWDDIHTLLVDIDYPPVQ